MVINPFSGMDDTKQTDNSCGMDDQKDDDKDTIRIDHPKKSITGTAPQVVGWAQKISETRPTEP
jgi:hypothetical protein